MSIDEMGSEVKYLYRRLGEGRMRRIKRLIERALGVRLRWPNIWRTVNDKSPAITLHPYFGGRVQLEHITVPVSDPVRKKWVLKANERFGTVLGGENIDARDLSTVKPPKGYAAYIIPIDELDEVSDEEIERNLRALSWAYWKGVGEEGEWETVRGMTKVAFPPVDLEGPPAGQRQRESRG